MIQRSEVEALLGACKRASVPDGLAYVLSELCRTWLSVQDSPKRKVVGGQWDDVFMREGNIVWCDDLPAGQVVRLVADPGRGE